MNRPTVVNDGGTKKTTTTTPATTATATGKEGSLTGPVTIGSVVPVSAQLGADIKNDYNYERDIKPNNAYGEPNNTPANPSNGSTVKASSVSGTYSSSANNTPVVTPATPVEADTTVQDSYKAAMEAANERLKQAYEYQQGLLGKEKDNAMREAYIKQQMVQRGYPEQLAAAGIRGGAAQGLIARNNADYANQRTSVYNNYLNGVANAGQTYQQGVLQNNQEYLAQMAAYQQALDEMRRKWEMEQLENAGYFGGTSYGNITAGNPQEYLNNLRATYGNLFK